MYLYCNKKKQKKHRSWGRQEKASKTWASCLFVYELNLEIETKKIFIILVYYLITRTREYCDHMLTSMGL